MILHLPTSLPGLRELGDKARNLGRYVCYWDGDDMETCHVEIRVSPARYAVVRERKPKAIGALAHQKRCILKCIRHAEELALREIYGE